MSHAVIHADALTYLRGNRWLVQNGFIPKAHAILCDPPYGLEFMGKEWDKPKPSGLMAERDRYQARNDRRGNTESSPFLAAAVNKYVAGEDFQAWVTEWAGLLIDYVYPGALGLFFGGTRTYHRLAAGLEDAGWEITDSMCVWVHAQGFPKSASIGKLLDKEAGAEREVVGRKGGRYAYGFTDEARDHFRGMGGTGFTGDASTIGSITAPATPLAARWEGYGTALKPAYEPIVIARAPRGKRTYAALAREFGTGALAIDAARIGTDVISNHGGGVNTEGRKYGGGKGIPTIERGTYTNTGRFPANFGLICACEGDDHADDCPVSVLGRQSGISTTPATVTRGVNTNTSTFRLHEYTKYEVESYGDTGTAARFFYQAKAAAWEREAGLHDRTRKIGGGRTMLRPRADLTPEKRAWLEAELERRGIA